MTKEMKTLLKNSEIAAYFTLPSSFE
jgi:hypothetical protein